MCGIAGFSLAPAEGPINAKRLARLLLLGIEHRGQDATGFCYIAEDGQVQLHKTNVAASKFIKLPGRFNVPKDVRTLIGHTRFATQGSPLDNRNNHPLQSGHLIGVHNGWLYNDVTMWKRVGMEYCEAEVDSAAIWGAMAYGTKENFTGAWDYTDDVVKPYTDEVGVLEDISGNAAVAWLNTFDPTKLTLARAESSPLCVVTTVEGSRLFGSVAEPLVEAAEALGMIVAETEFLPEGELRQYELGALVMSKTFKVDSYYGYSGGRSWLAGKSGAATPAIDDWDDDYTPATRRGEVEYDFHTGEWVAPTESDEIWIADVGEYRPALESAKVFDYDGVMDSLENLAPRSKVLETAYTDLRNRAVTCSAFDITFAGEDLVKGSYSDYYWRREEAIDNWLTTFTCNNDETAQKVCNNLKLNTRPGDAVTTKFCGVDTPGEVVQLPQSFPGGKYLLRLYVYNTRRDNNVECVLVERNNWEFTEENPVLLSFDPKEG